MVVFILTDNTNLEENVENQTTNNPNPNQNPKPEQMEEEHNRNVKIVARMGAMRHLISLFRGGDHIIRSLGEALDNITNAIFNAQRALYNIISYRDSQMK